PPRPASKKKTKKKRSSSHRYGRAGRGDAFACVTGSASDRSAALRKIARRAFAFLLVLSAVVVVLLPAQTAEKTGAKRNYRAYVGTYTTKTASKGVYSSHFDPATGKMSSLILAAESNDASWVVVHPNRK